MPVICDACKHPQRHDIDLALADSRTAYTVVAERFGLDVMCLRRHKQNHFQSLLPSVLAVKTDPVTLLGELDVVKGAAQRFMVKAEQDEKMGMALVALREYRQTIEAEIRLASDLGVLTPHSKRFEQAVRAILEALEPFPKAKEAVLEKLRGLEK